MKKIISGKKIVFISSKNLDYLRNVQEINLLKKNAASVDVIGSEKKSYIKRILEVYYKIFRYDFSRVDVVFVGFAPQLILPVWYSKFKEKTLIVDFFISVYDTFVNDRKKFKDNSIISKFMKKIDEFVLEKADFYVADTKQHSNYFQEEFGALKEKENILYLEADIKYYYPKYIQKPMELKDKYIVLYFGSILPLQGIEIILETVEKLKRNKHIYFYLIGPIPKKNKKVNNENVKYIDWVSQSELADYIAMADLCLAGHFNGDIGKAKRTIPGKAYIYEAMKKKMILGDNKANRELFQEDEYHMYVQMGNVNALTDKILSESKRKEKNDL